MTIRRRPEHPLLLRCPYQGPEALRLEVVKEDKLVEELVIVPRRHVTVGPDPAATIVVPREDLATTLRMFELDKGAYHLNFTTAMRGLVDHKLGIMDLEKLTRLSRRVRQGGSDVYRVSRFTKGKVVLGATTILFQTMPLDPLAPPDEVGPPRSFAHRLGSWLARR